MVDLKPNLASYARVSYFRELHGDLRGATDAMRLAVAAGGDAPENIAYVQTLLGDLELVRGALGAARARVPRGARRASPDYAGRRRRARARRDARAGELRRGDPAGCARWSRGCRCPSTSIALGETELAAGAARRGAPRPRARAASSSGCCARNGVNTDAELALFEADHGSPRARPSRWRAGRGPRRRACARPTRSAGR